MPKQPTFDRFRISGEVGVADLGPVMAQLAQIPGLTITGTELVTDVVTFRSNNRGQHETTAAEFITAWLEHHPTFHRKELTRAAQEDGRKAPGIQYALGQLLEKGVIKKLDDNGNYSHAAVKHIEAPTKPRPKQQHNRHEVDHREFILRYMRSHGGKATREKLHTYFEAHGRKPASVGGALNVLAQRKLIRLLGEGQYELRVPKAKPEPKANGNGSHVEETTTEGTVTNG